MIRGQCNCGGVAFEADRLLTEVIVCHCSICRRATGANGIAVVLAANVDFRWLRGEDRITTWKKPGSDWQMSFCPACGSPLPGGNDEQRVFIPAALISEGGDDLVIAHHIWVDSKAAWDAIGDAGLRHPEAFGSGAS